MSDLGCVTKKLCGGGNLELGLIAMLPNLFLRWHIQKGVTVVGLLGQGPNAA